MKRNQRPHDSPPAVTAERRRAAPRADRPAVPGVPEPVPAAVRIRRRVSGILILLALLMLLGEVAWFSEPVQDWWIGRQPLEQLQVLAAEQPGSTRIRYHYAVALLRSGKLEESLRQARDAAVMDPTQARLYQVGGLAAGAMGFQAEALERLSRARALGDHSAPTLEALAVLRVSQRDMGAGLRLAEEVLRRDPRRAESWYLLGQCRGALGMPAAWTEAMERATRLAPRDARYWLGLAESWLFRDRPREALQAADRALALAPDSPLGWLARARALAPNSRTPEQVRETEAAFRRATDERSASPDDSLVGLQYFGAFLLEQGRFAEAASFLKRAWKVNPDDQAAAYALAQAYRRIGRRQEAQQVLKAFETRAGQQRDLRYLRSRVTADPANPQLHLSLARALEKAGQTQAAAAEYREARRLQSTR